MSMYCLVSKFTVSSGSDKFEQAFGRSGEWFKFFESCEDYLGGDLMKSGDGKTYILVDKWMSKADYEDFIEENLATFEQLKSKTNALYSAAEDMGEYDLLQ